MVLSLKLQIDNTELTPQSSVELLVVTIDNYLKFDQHINRFANQQDVSLMPFSG